MPPAARHGCTDGKSAVVLVAMLRSVVAVFACGCERCRVGIGSRGCRRFGLSGFSAVAAFGSACGAATKVSPCGPMIQRDGTAASSRRRTWASGLVMPGAADQLVISDWFCDVCEVLLGPIVGSCVAKSSVRRPRPPSRCQSTLRSRCAAGRTGLIVAAMAAVVAAAATGACAARPRASSIRPVTLAAGAVVNTGRLDELALRGLAGCSLATNTNPPLTGTQLPTLTAPTLGCWAKSGLSMPWLRAKVSAATPRLPSISPAGPKFRREVTPTACSVRAAVSGPCAAAVRRSPTRLCAEATRSEMLRLANGRTEEKFSSRRVLVGAISSKVRGAEVFVAACSAAVASQPGIKLGPAETPACEATSLTAPLLSPTPAAKSSARVAMPPASCQGRAFADATVAIGAAVASAAAATRG